MRARLEQGPGVQAEDRVHLRIVEHAFLHHLLGARRLLGDGRALLGGLEDQLHVPGSCARISDSTRAAASRMAMCVSWPQACITGTVGLRTRRWPCWRRAGPPPRFTGRPSMSARSATTGPGRPPLISATTPVRATPVCGSRPKPRSFSAMNFAVSTSRFDSSGCACRWRRQAIRSASAAAARRSSSAASGDAAGRAAGRGRSRQAGGAAAPSAGANRGARRHMADQPFASIRSCSDSHSAISAATSSSSRCRSATALSAVARSS